MKALLCLLGIALTMTGSGAGVELLSPTGAPIGLFGGGRRSFEVSLRNRTEADIILPIEFQLLQATSATVAPWDSPRPWLLLPLAAHQTVLERVSIDLPTVAEESPFLLRLTSRREIVGVIEMRVSPGGILRPLTNTLGPVMVAAISAELRRVLTESGFNLLERDQPRPVSAALRLAIYGSENAGNTTDLYREALAQAGTGTATIWIEPTDKKEFGTAPSYYPISVGQGVFVTVQEGTLSHLSTDPAAQLRLARIIRLALRQERLNLRKLGL
jgi:hypothetical protein